MSASWLLDTNVLIYAYDVADRSKQERAAAVMDYFAGTGTAALSTQTLSEFFSVITRQRIPLATAAEAEKELRQFVRVWPVFVVTPQIVLEAARGVRQHRMAFWDALVWATARLNQIPCVLTEDVAGASPLEGVSYVNPFSPAFSLANLR